MFNPFELFHLVVLQLGSCSEYNTLIGLGNTNKKLYVLLDKFLYGVRDREYRCDPVNSTKSPIMPNLKPWFSCAVVFCLFYPTYYLASSQWPCLEFIYSGLPHCCGLS